MKIFLILGFLTILPAKEVEFSPPNYIIYQANSKAAKAITQTFYFEYFRNRTQSDYIGYDETESNWASLKDGSLIYISKSYFKKRVKFTCRILCKNYDSSYSVTSRHILSEDDEDTFQTLLLWNLISLFNPTNHELRNLNETYYDYEVEK